MAHKTLKGCRPPSSDFYAGVSGMLMFIHLPREARNCCHQTLSAYDLSHMRHHCRVDMLQDYLPCRDATTLASGSGRPKKRF